METKIREISQSDYCVGVPADWVDTSTLVYTNPTEQDSSFVATITVSRWYPDRDEQLEDFSDRQIQALINLFNSLELVKNEYIKIDGINAKIIVYQFRHENILIKQAQIFFLRNNKGFIFSYTNVDSSFDAHFQLFLECVQRFRELPTIE